VNEPLNLFYEEPESDRWLPFDRHPRRLIRRLVRGKPRVGGQKRVFLNLCAGLDQLGVKYRVNDYRHVQKHPDELACIIGKPHVLDKIAWKNPILFGAAVYSHPLNDHDLLKRLIIRRILVPGEWMRKMCEPYWCDKVEAWPVGIDTELWKPKSIEHGDRKSEVGGRGALDGKATDFLVYDKVRWEHGRYEGELIQPIRDELKRRGLNFTEIRYGFYDEEEFERQLHQCKAMIFLCEHETQGIAYQQALATGVPILAWDRGGFWQDPEFYPRIKFEPVSSVPYWDARCGLKFKAFFDFATQLELFLKIVETGGFKPRDFVLESLTLENCAKRYFGIANQCRDSR
jgi:glycosyltransferase involved in cell wall biosynthesis